MDSNPVVNKPSRHASAYRPATVGMLCAVAYAAVLVGRVIPDVIGFLSYDPKDVIVVIGGFIYGPLTSVIISVIVSFVEMITISSTGPYGFIMNAVSTCAFAVPAALIYKKMHNMKGAVLGLLAGVAGVSVAMVLWNWIITPLYMKMDRAVVAAMLPTVFLPFNLVKGALNAAITMLLYKPVVNGLRAAKLIEGTPEGRGRKINFPAAIGAAAVLVAGILVFALYLMKL